MLQSPAGVFMTVLFILIGQFWAYKIVFEGASVETQITDFSEPVIVIYMYSLLEFGKVGRIYRHEARSKKYV